MRRVERKGRPIIPDINLDELEEGNVYVCFRRREVKAVRKTRRMEITSVEKLTRLNIEFEIALELVDKVVEREEIKREICAHDANIWGHRGCMIAVTNKFPNLRSPEDDKYLIDKEKVKRKPLGVDTTNILRIPRGGLPSAGALFSAGGLRTALLHEEEQDLGQAIVHPRERYEQIQKLIEGDLHTKNEAMYGMEDHTDVRWLSLPLHHYLLLTFLFFWPIDALPAAVRSWSAQLQEPRLGPGRRGRTATGAYARPTCFSPPCWSWREATPRSPFPSIYQSSPRITSAPRPILHEDHRRYRRLQPTQWSH